MSRLIGSSVSKLDVLCRLESRSIASASGCKEWQGARDQYGYGHISVAGTTFSVHRVVWELTSGPEGMIGKQVCHACDNPPCWEIDHLFLGASGDNMRDAWRKGRARHQPQGRGEKNVNAKLTWAIVEECRQRFAAGEGQSALAREFEVHHGTMWELLHGKTWITP